MAVVLQYTIQYNTQKTQNNTYTLKTIHNTQITNYTKLQKFMATEKYIARSSVSTLAAI
jgi:hypothetical protein